MRTLHPQHLLTTRRRTLLWRRRSIRKRWRVGSLHTCAARVRRATSASCAVTWWSSSMQARQRVETTRIPRVEGRHCHYPLSYSLALGQAYRRHICGESGELEAPERQLRRVCSRATVWLRLGVQD